MNQNENQSYLNPIENHFLMSQLFKMRGEIATFESILQDEILLKYNPTSVEQPLRFVNIIQKDEQQKELIIDFGYSEPITITFENVIKAGLYHIKPKELENIINLCERRYKTK